MNQADLERRIDEVAAQLRERLAPEDFGLVRQLRHLEELALLAACAAWEQRCLDALVQHFTEHALALRAVSAHVRNTDAQCDTLSAALRAPGGDAAPSPSRYPAGTPPPSRGPRRARWRSGAWWPPGASRAAPQ